MSPWSIAARLDPSRARFVTLDEYRGIAAKDRRRLLLWLRRELLDPIGVGEDRVVAFDPEADPDAEPARVEAEIARLGGIDLAIVGLGPNGHVGFNEPGSGFDSRSRRVALAPESIRSNAAYWGSEDDVPREGFTLGLGTLTRCPAVWCRSRAVPASARSSRQRWKARWARRSRHAAARARGCDRDRRPRRARHELVRRRAAVEIDRLAADDQRGVA